MHVCMSIFSNSFSDTTRPIEAKYHVEPLWARKMKSDSNGPDHMINVAAMPIYGKNLKNTSSL